MKYTNVKSADLGADTGEDEGGGHWTRGIYTKDNGAGAAVGASKGIGDGAGDGMSESVGSSEDVGTWVG